MAYPDFSTGEVLAASDLDAIGLWLVKTQTVGTGVTSVTVNDAFSATYENYKIIWSGGQSSAASEIYLQLTTGGTASTASYYGTLVWASLTTTAVAGASDNNAARWSWAGSGAGGSNDGAASLNVDLLNPYSTKRTRLHHAQVVYNTVYGTYTGLHDLGTSYDGIKLTPASGTLTGGTIRVYGYRN